MVNWGWMGWSNLRLTLLEQGVSEGLFEGKLGNLVEALKKR